MKINAIEYEGYVIVAEPDPNFGGFRTTVYRNGHVTLVTGTIHSNEAAAILQGKRRIDTGEGIRY